MPANNNHVKELHARGYCVLKSVFTPAAVASARHLVLANLSLFKNTRPTPSSAHLAGFHRFPALEPLHTLITGNSLILAMMDAACGGDQVQTIGLSDITVNRSQPWHKDLLRGKFKQYLQGVPIYSAGHGLYKALVYLQAGASLRVMPGSHLQASPLDSDKDSEPGDDDLVEVVPVEAGDVVIMDIRLNHRGSPEQAFHGDAVVDNPKILVSTVFGACNNPLTHAMEEGNFHRLMDWMARHP